jgi:hypothetical protein
VVVSRCHCTDGAPRYFGMHKAINRTPLVMCLYVFLSFPYLISCALVCGYILQKGFWWWGRGCGEAGAYRRTPGGGCKLFRYCPPPLWVHSLCV